MDNKTQMFQDLEFFERDILKPNNLQCIIGGSFALSVMGFELTREPGDIDMEVTDNSCARPIFEALQKAHNLNRSNYTGSKSPYIFKYGKTTFNVWLVQDFSYKTFVKLNYFRFGDIATILRAKAKYQRKKDYIDFASYSNTLFSYLKESRKTESNEQESTN